jgi:hypothetical protein
MPNSMVILISTGRPWRSLELASLHMRNRINGDPGILAEYMDTTWAPPWTTTDATKFISQKQKARELLTLLSFFLQKRQCHIDLQRIWPTLQTHPLQRRTVTLAQRNSKHCANYQRFLRGPSVRSFTTCTPSGANLLTIQEYCSTVPYPRGSPPPRACKSRLSQQLQASLHTLPVIHIKG